MEIRPYQKGDEEKILELFEKAFNRPLSYEFWNWRYSNNPSCEEKMVELMWDGDLLVGHYAVSPVILNCFGEKHLSALSMTTMTHPEYGGKGIFTTLAETLYSRVEEELDVKSVWGFPNFNSHYGFTQKLKWQDVAVIPTLTLTRQNCKIAPEGDYRLTDAFTEEHSNLINSDENSVSVFKSKEYLNWRYKDNPINSYKIIELKSINEGFAVFKIFKSGNGVEIDIVDLYTSGFNSLKELIGSLLVFLAQNFPDWNKINVWCNIHHTTHLYFERLQFKFDNPSTILSFRPFSVGNELTNYKYWHLAMGDSDVY